MRGVLPPCFHFTDSVASPVTKRGKSNERNTAQEIARVVRDLCIEANRRLPQDVETAVRTAADREEKPLAREIMGDLLENMQAARELELPVCQDTGMAVVFADVGQEVHITGGLLADAVNKGVSAGYVEGRLRCSVVGDPCAGPIPRTIRPRCCIPGWFRGIVCR